MINLQTFSNQIMLSMIQQTLSECTISIFSRSTNKTEFVRRVPSTMSLSEVSSLVTLLLKVIPDSYFVIEGMSYDSGDNK